MNNNQLITEIGDPARALISKDEVQKSFPGKSVEFDPSPEALADPKFHAIYQVIKDWDIDDGSGYCHGTGSHAMQILTALRNIPVTEMPV